MSPNQLTPQQPYTLSYFITDHTDSNTYYVRAVVYDAVTGEVLDTQNLAQQSTNSRLFSKVAQAPGDSSGHGRRIIVVATAYDDSGYTSKSPIYQEQSENYIVVKPGAGLTLGGGGGVDYYVVREIFAEELKKVIQTLVAISNSIAVITEAIKAIPTTKYNLEPLQDNIKLCSEMVAKIPLDNSVDLSEVVTRLDNALQAIADKPVTGVTDLTPVASLIEDLKEEINNNHSEHVSTFGQHMSDLHTVLPGMIREEAGKAMGKHKYKFVLDDDAEKQEEKPEEKPKKKFNIRNLLG